MATVFQESSLASATAATSRQRRKPRTLFMRFLLAFLLIDVLGTSLFSLYASRYARAAASQSIDYRLMSAALALLEILGEDYLRQAQYQGGVDPSRYRQVQAVLGRYVRNAGLAALYAFVKQGDELRLIADSAAVAKNPLNYYDDYRQRHGQPPPELLAVFTDHQPRFANYQDNLGSFRSLFLAIPGDEGRVLVIAGEMFMEGVEAAQRNALYGSLLIGVLLFLVGMLLSLVLARMLERSVKRLGRAAERIAEGDYQLGLEEGHDPAGRLGHTFNQMGAALAARERRISQLAFHDPLTRLPNQVRLVLDIRQRLERIGSATVAPFTVLLLDICNFRGVNELLGQEGGDKILCHLAWRLRAASLEEGAVARIGGDTFALLLPHFDASSAETMLVSLRALLAKPFLSGNQRVPLRITLGIACPPEHGDSAEALLANAETAMREARRQGLAYAFHDPEQERQRQDSLALLDALDFAVTQNQLRLYLQPKIGLAQGSVEGAEILLRWQHPRLGLVGPDIFIGLAEQSRKICDITLWLLEQVMRLQVRSVLGRLKLNVNLSLLDLESPTFATRIGRLLDDTGASARAFCLEITESRAMSRPVQVLECLRQLKAMGFELALDDFGAGHSSLACLSSFPIDELKIDRQFIERCHTPEDREVIRLLIQLGRLRGLRVVAEGVETAEALAILRGLDCDQIQGRLVVGALPLDEFIRWYARGRGRWSLAG